MPKIKSIGKGFIQIGETLYNLIQYKKIEKYTFGYKEDPDGNLQYGILVTPLITNKESIKNGVDGSFMLTSYKKSELEDFKADFDTIISILKD